MVLLSASGGGGGVPGGGGCGTAASRPFGVNGVIVIKITSSTSRISMNGVTLISAFAEIFFFTFFIWPLLLADLIVHAFGQQTDLIDAGIPDVVDNHNQIAIFCAAVAFHEDSVFQLGSEQFIHISSEIVHIDL